MSEDEARKAVEDEVEGHFKARIDEPADEARKEDEDEVEAHMRKT